MTLFEYDCCRCYNHAAYVVMGHLWGWGLSSRKSSCHTPKRNHRDVNMFLWQAASPATFANKHAAAFLDKLSFLLKNDIK